MGDPGSLTALATLDTQTWPEPWRSLVGTPLNILIVVVLSLVARWVAHRLIDRFARRMQEQRTSKLVALTGAAGRIVVDATGLASERRRKRTQTMAALLKSVATVVILGTGLLMVLDLMGLPLGPVLASASVGGLALGIGAQSLVRDFLSGIFMLAEDQYGVGDTIDVGAVTGTVEDVSLRITRLRDGNGVVWYVRNGEIMRVGNISQGWSVATVDVQVGYKENLARVTALLTNVVDSLASDDAWKDKLLEEPVVGGIESLSGGLVTLRITAKTPPNEQFGVQREIRERVKVAFDENGVSLPVPPMVPYAGGPAS